MGENIDLTIARRLKALRAEHGLSIEALAAKTGVSRAMISRIERAESSATAALLGRICAGLGLAIGRLLAEEGARAQPLARRAAQPVWRDPETGYLRRQVSPPDAESGIEIAEVTLPPGTRIAYPGWSANVYHQQVVMLSGRLEIAQAGATLVLEPGDRAVLDVGRDIVFASPGAEGACYLVIMRR